MARASEKPPVTIPGEVTLRLAKVEAEALAVLIYCAVSGDPSGPRGHVSSVLNALRNARIVPNDASTLKDDHGWVTRGLVNFEREV